MPIASALRIAPPIARPRPIDRPVPWPLALAVACACAAISGCQATSFVEIPQDPDAQSALLLVVPANEAQLPRVVPVVMHSPESGSDPSAIGGAISAALTLADGDTVHVLYYRCPLNLLRLDGPRELLPGRDGRPLPRTGRVQTAVVGRGGQVSFARGEWPQQLLEYYSLEPTLDPCEGLEPGPEVSVGKDEPLLTNYGDEGVIVAADDFMTLKLIVSESNGTSTALTTKTTTIAPDGVMAAHFHEATKTLYVVDPEGILHALHARDAGNWEKGFETTRSSTQAISSSDPHAFQIDRTQMVACDTDRGVELWVAGSNTFLTSPTALRVAAYEDTGRVLRLKAKGEILKTPGQSEDVTANHPDLAWTCADGESPIALVPDGPRRSLAALRPSASSTSSTPWVSYSPLSVLDAQEVPFAILAHSELGLIVAAQIQGATRIRSLVRGASGSLVLLPGPAVPGEGIPAPVLIEAPPVRDDRSGSEDRGILWHGDKQAALQYHPRAEVNACVIPNGGEVKEAAASGRRVYLRIKRGDDWWVRSIDFAPPDCGLDE